MLAEARAEIDQTMMAELARFSLGRVLLHFIAMLRDGAVRFHAAGIARELSWVVGGAAPLLARVHAGLIGALALYLTQPGKRYRPLTTKETQPCRATPSTFDSLETVQTAMFVQPRAVILELDQRFGRGARPGSTRRQP